ncbi:MAG: hypothetical protein JHC33_01875 [Ignisphaera sp.]|nr:hypothetical protein [Ignisphaera sp.]
MTELNITRTGKLATDDISSLAAQSRKHLEDNPLLEALTLVIESNAEYARGVTTILDSDLEREVLLNDIKKDLAIIKKLVEKNNIDMTAFNTQLLTVLARVEKLDLNIESKLGEKLAPLYIAADLQESGEQYNPTDKLVVTAQKVLSSKLFTMLAGVAIWMVVKFLFEGLK